MPLTIAQQKALTILSNTSRTNTISARMFAEKMWGDTQTNMFTSSKNQGNGACRGKAAWLCAGSYLGKLIKKGWVIALDEITGKYGFCITKEGTEALNN